MKSLKDFVVIFLPLKYYKQKIPHDHSKLFNVWAPAGLLAVYFTFQHMSIWVLSAVYLNKEHYFAGLQCVDTALHIPSV